MPETAGLSLEVRILEGPLPETWTSLLADAPFKPYHFVPEVSDAARTAVLRRRIERAVSQPGSTVAIATADGDPRGLAVAVDLAWETRFFGFGCARLEALLARGADDDQVRTKRALLRAIHPRLERRGFRSVHSKTDTKDFPSKWALEAEGYLFSEVSIFWTGRFEEFSGPPPQVVRTRALEARDLPHLRQASRDAMEYNRFLSDLHFPRAKVHEMYERVVDACCDGSLAEHVLVAEADGRAVGMVALEFVKDVEGIFPWRVANFRYLVRSPKAPPGTGPSVLEAGCEWLRGRCGLTESQTTMQNTGMIRTAVRKGFRVQTTNADYYKWFGPGER